MDKTRCPYCDKSWWSDYRQVGESWSRAEDGQWYHESCEAEARAELAEIEAMHPGYVCSYQRMIAKREGREHELPPLLPGQPVWEVKE